MHRESARTDADRLAILQEWQASGRSAKEFAEVVVAPGSHTAHPTSIEILLDDVVIRVPSGSGSSDVAVIVHAVRSAGRIAC